ncbi:MAG: secondary thiamine-phosphate synthase enzyme YjbQ [Geminicoccaceae bacterium]|nr:secondary thiamine-phosphate synthase enzyme YjbQ [Geminicoccaceae bacterium]MCS7267526.1 secondary thiamine-phosphate synthase enzyme YjbQ [Geminicoccaceae bacterium]MCX7631128.1 secondary thiamine-phosphate synthase enzyme YjbQ [Geminicoccaceae bacterium]MDW8123730.1 secondary thiamine-phosphate synthase enzyme YjbQ [Geminicoccaceae bacterium]MDW8341851.1 secondary thiamine-phosphate synthase enzyme YjbQ [Geminicoccaceae bacterium]
MIRRERLVVETQGRGFRDLTARVREAVARLAPDADGLAHLFCRHTSCSLLITENADPDVRADLERLARRWAPDGDPAYAHRIEGPDDMAAHARSVLTGCALTVPFEKGRLLLGTWQGIYLWEHRTTPHLRELLLTVLT